MELESGSDTSGVTKLDFTARGTLGFEFGLCLGLGAASCNDYKLEYYREVGLGGSVATSTSKTVKLSEAFSGENSFACALV